MCTPSIHLKVLLAPLALPNICYHCTVDKNGPPWSELLVLPGFRSPNPVRSSIQILGIPVQGRHFFTISHVKNKMNSSEVVIEI